MKKLRFQPRTAPTFFLKCKPCCWKALWVTILGFSSTGYSVLGSNLQSLDWINSKSSQKNLINWDFQRTRLIRRDSRNKHIAQTELNSVLPPHLLEQVSKVSGWNSHPDDSRNPYCSSPTRTSDSQLLYQQRCHVHFTPCKIQDTKRWVSGRFPVRIISIGANGFYVTVHTPNSEGNNCADSKPSKMKTRVLTAAWRDALTLSFSPGHSCSFSLPLLLKSLTVCSHQSTFSDTFQVINKNHKIKKDKSLH